MLNFIAMICGNAHKIHFSAHSLYDYLLQLNHDTQETFSKLVKRMAIQEGVTEQLKNEQDDREINIFALNKISVIGKNTFIY